jgi:hypothetical protein
MREPTLQTRPTGWLARAMPVTRSLCRGLFLWRGWLYLAYIAVALLLVVGIVNAAGSYGSSGDLKVELERLRMQGAPLSCAQAAPPAIPADQNAAPLYLKVAAQIEPHQPKGAGYPEGRIGQGGWKPGQPMLYGVADWWNPDAMKALSDLVRSDEKSLQLLYQAAARPGCRFDLKWSDGFAMTLPHLAKMRAICRFCVDAAAAAVVEGNSELAGRRLKAAVAMACHATQEPTLISQLVAYAITNMAERTAEFALSKGSLSEADAREILAKITDLKLSDAMIRSLQTERAMVLDVYDMARRDPASVGALIDSSEGEQKITGWMWWLYVKGFPSLINADELTYLEFVDWSLRAAALPWDECQSEYQKMEEWSKEHLTRALIARSLGPAVYRVAQRRFETEALLNLISGSLGLALYKQKTGQFPQSLDALAQINWPVPQDPFTDAPMKYRVQGDRYLLYSVGKDGLDDGGKPVWKMISHPPGPPPADQDLGDMPWQWR